MFDNGSIVIANLNNPSEKLWGAVERLEAMGLLLRGLNVETFDDWMSQAASGEPLSLGLGTLFVPMARIERIYLDEQVGAVESYCQRFERRVGVPVQRFIHGARWTPTDSATEPS